MLIELTDGRKLLYQWDTGRRVRVGDKSIKEVHYSNRYICNPVTVEVAEDMTAAIPDELLQTWNGLIAYAYAKDESGCYTKVQADFPVHRRPKPSNYIYTPTERAGFDRLQKEIGDLSTLETAAKDNLVAAINEAAASGGADWNQNDPTAKDYIKHRPEYLIDVPAFTGKLRVAKDGEPHYGIYSSKSEDLQIGAQLYIAGMCYDTDVDNRKTMWLKIGGSSFEVYVYYEHDHYNISYMQNGEEIFVQSWRYYSFLESTTTIDFNDFFDAVGISEIVDPSFSFYEVKPYPIPTKDFSGYVKFTAYTIENLVYLNRGDYPNTIDKVQIADDIFYDVPCISKEADTAKYTAGNHTIIIKPDKQSGLRYNYNVKIEPEADLGSVFFYRKNGLKWESGGIFEIHTVDLGDIGSGEESPVTLDKTFAEIKDAVANGKTPVVIFENSLRLPLSFTDGQTYQFEGTYVSREAMHVVIRVSNDREPMGLMSIIVTRVELSQMEYILQSTTQGSTKKFKITVDDSGTLSAVEVT